MRWPRIALGALGTAATVAVVTFQEPQAFSITGPAGIVAFVVAAGCLAADAVPYRPVHAAAAAASIADAILLAVGGQVGVPVVVPAVLLVLLQVAPAARDRWVGGGPRRRLGS